MYSARIVCTDNIFKDIENNKNSPFLLSFPRDVMLLDIPEVGEELVIDSGVFRIVVVDIRTASKDVALIVDYPANTSDITIRLDPCWDVSPGSICRRGGAGCPLPHEDDWRSMPIKSLESLEWHLPVYTLSFDPKKIGIQFPHNANKRQLKQFMKKLRKIDKQFLKIPYSS